MGRHDDDFKKAEKMTEREMLDSAERGRRWSNAGDFWDDFKGKFQDNLWVVKYGWIVIVVILAIIIIDSSNKPQKGVCHHNIDTVNYSVQPYGPDFAMMGECSLCNKEFTVYSESSSFVEYKQPTCEEMGANVYKVVFKIQNTTREVLYENKMGPMLGHLKPEVLIEEYVPATCEEDGHNETYDCGRCGKRIVGTVISKLGHIEVEDPVVIEPTCLTEGRQAGVYCSRCKQTVSGYEVIPIVPCNYEHEVTPPTYTTKGFTTHTCIWCDDTFDDTFVNALVYNYVNLGVIEGRESEGLYVMSIAEGCTEGNIVIPEEVDGVKVVGVAEYAFKDIKTLKSIKLPSTVKNIFNNAFENCENLTTFDFSENITFIGSSAFKGCKSLTSVKIDSKVESLKSEVFADCINLKSVTLNSTIKNIEEKAFGGCKQIVQIVLPETLSSVNADAFKNCIRLVEIYDLKNSFSSCYPESVVTVKTSIEEKSGIEVHGDYECVRGDDGVFYVFRVNPTNEGSFVMPKTINEEEFELLPYSLTNIKNYSDVTITNISCDSFKKLISDGSDLSQVSMQVTNLCLDINEAIPSGYFVDCFEGIKKVKLTNLISEGVIEADQLEEIEMPVLFSELRKVFAGLAVPYYLEKITFTGGETLPANYCKNIDTLTTVVLPDSLTTIGVSAFNGCENLENVTFGNSLETISESAFYACYKLKELALPDSLKVIDSYAFKYCSAIERVVIPKNVTTINSYAFDICPNIKEVYNLSSLEIVARTISHGGVAENVYYVYTSLEEENKIFFEGDYIFVLQKDDKYHLVAYNGEAEDLVLPEQFNGESYILDARVFKDCFTVKNLVIASSITQIPDEAFKDCSSFESVVIGEGVSSIGSNAFNGCIRLSSITFASSVKQIGENAFVDCGTDAASEKVVKYDGTALTWLEISFANEKATPMSFASKILMNVDGEYESVTSLTIPNTTTSIKAYQFYGFSDVTTLVVPSSVVTIGRNAFYNVNNVKTATIPSIKGVFSSMIEEVTINTNVSENFFTNWNNLKTVTVAEGVTSIGSEAFAGCAALESVRIPKSLTTVGIGAFNNCSSLKALSVDSENEKFASLDQGFGLVEKNTNTLLFGNETSVITDGIVHIAPYAFYNNKNVRTMAIPSSVQTIGDYAFYNCYGMSDITFSNNIVSIGEYAFYNFFNLKSLDFSASTKLTSIGAFAFKNCEDIETLSLPASVVSVGESAIDSDCKKLTSVTMPAVNDYFAYIFGGAAYIPSNVKSVTIISGDIPASYFSGCSNLTHITLQGTTSIGQKAFYYCKALTDLSLPNTLKSIDSLAFSNCSELEGVNLPSGLEELGANAFENCKKLKSIVIPKSVTKLNVYTFNGCEALESITFESGTQINEIDKCFVYGCGILKELAIPASVTKLWRNALMGCNNIETLTIPKLEFYDTYTTGLKLAELFSDTVPSSLKNVTILSATSIPEEAFYNCSSIQSITFPDNVTSVGKNALYNCSALTYNVSNGGKYLATSTNDYFCLVEVSDSTITSFEVNSNCKIIYASVFSNATNLESVAISEGLLSIGENAFSGCSKLTQINFPSSLKEIGKSAFASTKLESVTLPKDLKTIGESAFSGVSTLTSVEFATGCEVENIGKEAFKNCTGLTSIDFTNAASLKVIGEYCFDGCTGLTAVVFSNSIEEIGANAFRELTKITSLTLPTSLKVIGDYAFYNFTITELTIPSSVQTIGNYSFYHCTSLTSLTFADNSAVSKIGDYAFYSCKVLTSIDFGENSSLTEIGSYSFNFCNELVSITLPKKLSVIGEGAFAYCSKLESVLFEQGSELKELKDSAFEGCTKLKEIYISKSVTKIGLAFAWASTTFTIYYGGSSSDWKNITISKGQNGTYQVGWLTNATFVYNS